MRTSKLALIIVLTAATGLGCGDSKSSGADGGATGGSGGASATGGTAGTGTGGTGGGAGGRGGTAGTGTGGAATGGTGAAAGGTAGTGTGGTGGAATGGTAGSGTAGTGGMAGSGTGGAAGSGTGGTGGASASCDVPCLSTLIMGCAPEGTCMQQISTTTFAVNQCYSNGVKVSSGATAGGIVLTYSKAGTVCYSAEAPITAGSTSFTVTYKNAAGTVVATGMFDSAMNKATVTCTGGMTYDLNGPGCANVPRGPGGMGMGGAGGQCTMGACP